MRDFTFLASWYDVIKAYEDAGQEDMASTIAKEIITYGVTGETATTDPLVYGLVRGLCANKLRDKKGGRPPKYDKSEIVELYNQWNSEEDIAKQLGCSVKTVKRVLVENDEI